MDDVAFDRSIAYLESWLPFRHATSVIPGLAVAVARHGQVALDVALGYADVATSRILRPEHVFRIASHSKSFTATAVLQLAEEGCLRLDDPVGGLVPWLAEHPDDRFGSVTVRQLLCHGAGVVRDGEDADFWQLGRPFPDAGQLRSEILDARLVTDPNVAFKYSNYGFGLLGLVVEAVAGRPYHEHVRNRIVEPLGLSSTGPEWEPGLGKRAVTGYGRRHPDGSRRPLPPVDTRALAPATGWYSTASELCRYFDALVTGDLLDDASRRELRRIHWKVRRPGPGREQGYGLGSILETVGERDTFGHSGGFPGHITRTLCDPEDRLVVSVLTSCIDGPASEIARGVLGVLDWFQHHAEAPTADLARLEGRYRSLWSDLDLAAAGDRMAVADPGAWAPFADADWLEAVDATTLRIADAGGFGSPGEAVHVDAAAGRIRYGGTTMWAADAWPAAEADLLGPS